MHESVELVVVEIWVVLEILKAILKRIGIEEVLRFCCGKEQEDDEERYKSHSDNREVFVFHIGFAEVSDQIGKESERP